MLEISNLSIKTVQGNRYLVENLNLIVDKNDKVALIGEEGNGKTTLLNVIYNSNIESLEITGSIRKKGKISYLKQFLSPEYYDLTVTDYFLYNEEINEIDYDNYIYFGNFLSNLNKYGVDFESKSLQLMKTLSGGELVKVRLAKILAGEPDILLLDEPSNDIDISMLEILEDIINKENNPVVFVSHDEKLLENTANIIVHLELTHKKNKARTTVHKMSYSDYVKERASYIEKENQLHLKEKEEWKNQKSKVNTIKEKIQRANPERQNAMRQMLATNNRLEKNKYRDFYDIEEAIDVYFDDVHLPKSKVIIDLNNYKLELKNSKIINNINLSVIGPEHITIIGDNGIGKTTLLKLINGLLKHDESLSVGYMPQNYDESLNSDENCVQFLQQHFHEESVVRNMLGRMKFTEKEQLSSVNELSGGQKAKLYLLKMILNKNNVLILDEPTRNLSPLSNPVIRKMLQEYSGAIISVSHDRKYIDEVSDKVYIMKEDGLRLKEAGGKYK